MKKSIKFMSAAMALAMCFSAMPMGAFALEEAEAGANEVQVSLTIGETYTVKIPKTIVLDAGTKSAEYSVEVSGNIAGTKQVKVAPDATFLLSQDGKDDVTATITQDVQTVASAEIEDGTAVTVSGSIAAPDATSGTWNGSFNFEIALESAVELISFTINGTTYQAEEGMTWAEWVESEYNTDGYHCLSSGLVETANNRLIESVFSSDPITNGMEYSYL